MQDNEFQTRREFFKNAAKSTLPILGLAVLATLPVQNPTTGCEACTGGCISCIGCGGMCTGCEGSNK